MVEYDLAKVGVAGSSPVSRSCKTGILRDAGIIFLPIKKEEIERISSFFCGPNDFCNAPETALLVSDADDPPLPDGGFPVGDGQHRAPL